MRKIPRPSTAIGDGRCVATSVAQFDAKIRRRGLARDVDHLAADAVLDADRTRLGDRELEIFDFLDRKR
jgi:hypothetical protein